MLLERFSFWRSLFTLDTRSVPKSPFSRDGGCCQALPLQLRRQKVSRSSARQHRKVSSLSSRVGSHRTGFSRVRPRGPGGRPHQVKTVQWNARWAERSWRA